MLIDAETLDSIVAGRVSIVFRRWASARVRPGTRLRTRLGVLEVGDVSEVIAEAVDDGDIAEAGFSSRAAFETWVDGRSGRLFRITLQWAGPDPRVALREQPVEAGNARELLSRLSRLDAAASRPWTTQTLRLIETNPGRVSTELALEVGEPRDRFKRRVRQLKELGLTESLEVGYRLSVRGETLLELLESPTVTDDRDA